MFNISAILFFLTSRFFASNKTCFSSKEKGDAIANALIISSMLCFSSSFQLITNPLFSNNIFKSLKIPGIEETVVTPPNIIFKDKMDIYVGEYHLELIHVKGHTDGDLFIYIEALKTLITGDLILNKRIPYMGEAYIEDWIKAINYMGDLNAEIYIPGHGDPGGKPVLIAMKHYLIELRQMVENQIKNGSSLTETQDAVRPKLKAKYSNWEKLEWLDGNIKRAYREFSLK